MWTPVCVALGQFYHKRLRRVKELLHMQVAHCQKQRNSIVRHVREMLALVWACKFFRPYLLGQKFTVRTDHHALQWLTKFKEPEGQVARWLESLAEFEMVVIHQPGKAHVNADVLSQRPCNSMRSCRAGASSFNSFREYKQLNTQVVTNWVTRSSM